MPLLPPPPPLLLPPPPPVKRFKNSPVLLNRPFLDEATDIVAESTETEGPPPAPELAETYEDMPSSAGDLG